MLLTVSISGPSSLANSQVARERVLANLLRLAETLLDHPAAYFSLLIVDLFRVIIVFRLLIFFLYFVHFIFIYGLLNVVLFLWGHLLLQAGSLLTLQAEAARAYLLLPEQLLVHFLVAHEVVLLETALV